MASEVAVVLSHSGGHLRLKSPPCRSPARSQAQQQQQQHTAGPPRIILNPQMRLVLEEGADRRRENLPTSDEVAVIFPDE